MFPATGCSADENGAELITECTNGFTAASDGSACICIASSSPSAVDDDYVYGAGAEICTSIVGGTDDNPPITDPIIQSCEDNIFQGVEGECAYDPDTNTYTVTECQDGFYVDADELLCLPCRYVAEGCSDCEIDDSDEVICTDCGDGFYSTDGTGDEVTCTVCPENCATCTSDTDCTSLFPGSPFYLDGGDVISCDSDNMYWCDHDESTYELVTVYCNAGYYRDNGDTECTEGTETIENCLEFEDETTCMYCKNGYQISPDGSECVACGENMAYCTVFGDSGDYTIYPQVCGPGYGSAQNRCVACEKMDPNCVLCNWVGTE